MSAETMTITERLAQFVVEYPTASIPEKAIEGAAMAFVDLLSVALAGSVEPASRIALKVTRTSVTEEAAIWGGDLRASAEDAAFVNGIQGHALDFDDSAVNMRGHASTVMLPAAMAAGEAVGASGREVMASYAVGLEVATRVSKALGPDHYLGGWHATGTAGLFGAVSAAGRLFALSPCQMQIAFGIASSQLASLARNLGTMTKPFHAGNAARCGVFSARLAREGFTADPLVFDGNQNVLTVYGAADSAISEEAMASLGSTWEVGTPGLYVKRWPCCFATHRPLATLQLIIAEKGLRAEDIAAVEVGFLPGAVAPLKYTHPKTALEGKFSIEYVVAALLLDGQIGLGSFTDDMILRPEAQEMAARVSRFTMEHEGLFSGLTGFTDVVVVTRDGARHEMRVDRTPGSPDWPLSVDERAEKFRDCASTVKPPEAVEALLKRAMALGEVPSVAGLTWH
jgi:2-methylcitrate dehydratase PrpD